MEEPELCHVDRGEAVKPPYVIPTMSEVAHTQGTNGYTMVSTFSGAGGSCLGFEMAGFKVAWANEFVEAARETYIMNHPGVIVDGRDIREVTAADILTATGLKQGELDVLEGSPPCASFSTAGSREKGWGKVKSYSDTVQRADDLFYEYARLVGELQPKVFVAENVSGLVKGKAIGYFKWIMQELRSKGYRVEAKLLDASWLGVPQARQRLIFIGVRDDLGLDPVFPTPLTYRYTVREVLPNVNKMKFGGKPHNYQHSDKPSPTVMASDGQTSPTAYFSSGGYIETHDQVTTDPETGREISITNYAIGPEWDKLQPGQASKRYFTLVKSHLDAPAQTIVAQGGNVGAAAITHPTQRRKFTLQELRILQSFPPDFQLTGTYEQRWERIGRSVPPLMAKAIAQTISNTILDRL